MSIAQNIASEPLTTVAVVHDAPVPTLDDTLNANPDVNDFSKSTYIGFDAYSDPYKTNARANFSPAAGCQTMRVPSRKSTYGTVCVVLMPPV